MNVYSFYQETANHEAGVALLDRKERHRLLRKTDILRAAERIFARKGYHQATIQDIAKEAQYATGTVYLYFSDKNALYLSMLEEKMYGLFVLLKEKTEKIKDIQDKLKAFIFENLTFFAANQDFFHILVAEEGRLSIKSRVLKLPVAIKYKEYFTGMIKQAQAEGAIRHDIEAKQISDMLMSIITSVIFSWLEEKPSQKMDLENSTEMIFGMFLNGAKKR